jgi:hypothetical protein
MRSFLSRRVMLAVASVLALAAAGIAVAGPAPSSMSLVSATFSTGAPTNSHSHTCTAANSSDQITVTDATYSGTASSMDSRLNGPITIHVHSVYEAGTANLGTVNGDVRIDNSATPPNHFHANLTGVDVNGNVQGWISGHAGPGAQIAGALAGPYTATGGFGSSTIGATTGSATNPAIITSGNCKNSPGKHHHGH